MAKLLRVEPPEVAFTDVKPGVLYVMAISVRNMGTVAQRIRLQAPKSSFYALNYIPAGPVAPGLDLRAEIEFQMPADVPSVTFRDVVVAMMGDDVVHIPLKAMKPFADLQFNPLVNFGNIMLGQHVTQEIVFENVSITPTTVTLIPPREPSLQLSMTKFDIKGAGSDGSKVTLKFTLSPKEVGPLRELIKVRVAGVVEDLQMDISAKVIEQNLTLLTTDKKGTLDNAMFGCLFYGETKTVDAVLVNSGPFPMSFSVKFDDEDESNAPQSDSTADSSLKSISVFPLDGIVRPFSSVPVQITFSPVLVAPEKGFSRNYRKSLSEPVSITRIARIECLDNMQSTVLQCSGSTVAPTVSVTPTSLRFGNCAVHDRRDILVTLTNQTRFPTMFELPPIANFKFTPSKGTLIFMETVSVVASFVPSQMGNFKVIASLRLANNLVSIPLKLFGESATVGPKKVLVTGTDKVPADFAVEYKFVDPEELAEARAEAKAADDLKNLKLEASLRTMLSKTGRGTVDLGNGVDMSENKLDQSLDRGNTLMSQERDDLYELDQSGGEPSNLHNAAFEQRRTHNQHYNKFLQNSHAARELRRFADAKQRLLNTGAIDFSDPNGINMGLERGLKEPELRIPVSAEPLWMAGNTSAGNASGPSKLTVDENRLIQKKYSSSPKTQAEVRDCAVELAPDQLKLITSSHKMIDFGKVCVGSSSAKSFAVSNGLKQGIFVSVEELEIELQQSKSLKQIIPEGCMAGFDIYFSSRTLGKVKKSFTWKINGIHMFKVHVAAEVVPIELLMNKQELVMEFPVDLLKPTLTSDVVLTNPGNAYADYLWGSGGAFKCDPEKGSIAPGKSAVMTVTWNPHAGKRQDEELGLHITGGVDQTLKVRGVLKETKAEFAAKRITLGVTAVGTEREVITQINNVGENPLVFFMNAMDDQLGIMMEPMEALVQPGESCDICVKITPKSARSYDNVSLSARVRGGKNIALKLSGSSIVPELEMQQPNFQFGSVTVGGLSKVSMCLVNRSPIAATLLLDLTSFPEFFPRLVNPLEEMDIIAREFGEPLAHQEDEAGNQIFLTQSSSSSKSSSPRRSKRKAVENIWKFIIQPSAELVSELVFKPTTSRKHSYRLPLHLMGISSDKSLSRDVQAIGVSSVLTVSNFVVNFNDRVVARDPLARSSYFMETVITNHSQSGVSFIFKEGAEVCQAFDGSIQDAVAVKDDSLTEASQIFFVSPLKADLPAGGSLKLRVTFQPQANALYHKKLELFLKDQETDQSAYLSILTVGSGVYPCMTFSTQMLRLPTVALGFTSRACFTIFNNGYNALDVRHRISPNITTPLDVQYPDGNQLSIMIDKIRVIITAKSEQPVSWFGKIEFYDMDGERFFVNISGCADNCLLTNYSFVRDYADIFGFIGLDDQPVQFLSKAQIGELKQAEIKRKEELRKLRSLERQRAVEAANSSHSGGVAVANSMVSSSTERKPGLKKSGAKKAVDVSLNGEGAQSYPDGVDIDRSIIQGSELIKQLDSEAKFLLKWLNRNVCKKPFDPDRFPLCMMESHGDHVIECLEQMSGKRITNLKPTESSRGEKRGSADKSDADASGAKRTSEKSKKIAIIDRLVYKHQQVLNFLIGHGALLSHINPVNLLFLEDSLIMQEYELVRDKSVRVTPALLASKRQLWEAQWPEISRSSWLEVLFQAVKMFVLSRLSYKDYCKLPGIVLAAKSEAETIANDSKGNGAEKKKRAPAYPKDFEPSNVFSHGEAVLLAWCSYHLQHADSCKDHGVDEGHTGGDIGRLISFNHRVTDLDATFRDYFSYCQLMHSHVEDITSKDDVLCGYTACDRIQHQDNLFEMFEEATRHYHIDIPGMLAEEILLSTRNIVMLLLHMFLGLPHLVPKTRIEFQGLLGVPVMKKIELKNTSKKPLLYKITMKGSEDFAAETKEVVIAAESNNDVVVTLNAKFMHPVTAKLYCWNVQELGHAIGATLCFELFSKITGIKPLEVFSRDASLYDLETFPIVIRNPFDREGQFQLRMTVRHCETNADALIKTFVSHKAGVPRKRSGAGKDVFKEIPLEKPSNEFGGDLETFGAHGKEERSASSDDWDVENAFRQPFWCSEENVMIPKGGSKTVTFFMLPFLLGKYQCEVVCVEKDLGEFSYLIEANVGLPKPVERLDMSSIQGQRVRLSLALTSKNAGFEKAFVTLTDQRIKNANKKIKARGVFQGLISSNVTNEDTGQSDFLVDFVPTFFDCNRNIPFVSEYMKWSTNNSSNTSKARKNVKSGLEVVDAEPTGVDALNKATFVFSPQSAGQYKCLAVVYAKDNAHRDVRCVELTFSSNVTDSKLQIEFIGPARKQISQELPVTNETDLDWNLAINISGANFSAPKQLTVPAHSTEKMQIGFCGWGCGSYEGKLQLKNSSNGDVFEYILAGHCEEPLAEDNVRFQCAARKKATFFVSLPSIESITGKPTSKALQVETDLPYVHCAKTCDVSTDGVRFPVDVSCPMGGTLSGMIAFKDTSDTQAMIWFTVRVDITAPNEEKSISVETVVRRAAAIEITLNNPTQDDLEFKVLVEGDGLLGSETFLLPSNERDSGEHKYELIYSPLLPGNRVGRVSFYNEYVGEIWYKLLLTALPASITDLGTVEAMLGTSAGITAPLENPLGEQVTVTVEVEDDEHFSVMPNRIVLPPYAQTEFEINFRPSSIAETIGSNIRLLSKQLGEILYRVEGLGLLPGMMPDVVIEGPLREISSKSILFRNPFHHPLPVEIVLVDESDHGAPGVFSLLMRKTSDTVVGPQGVLHIPVAFSPQRLSTFRGTLSVRSAVSGRQLLWCYPIRGVPEAGPAQPLPRLQTKSKTTIIKEHMVNLVGLSSQDVVDEETGEPANLKTSDFSVSLDMEDEVKHLVLRAFRFQILDIVSEEGRYVLRCRLLFEPLRVFSAAVSINVAHRSFGKWKVSVDMNALDPEPDDIIRLVAKVHGEDKVSFKLLNQFLGYSAFQAFFTSSSSPHFSVYPVAGSLAPYDVSDGTAFTVTFNPKEYGVVEQATLIILTEDAQWTYSLRGSYPENSVAQVKSKVDNKRK